VPKTVTVTLERFKENIPKDILTKTFQDAIDLCRRLKINFLWIDSLCIKQDDVEDWKSQAPKMAGIYETAILTIAASMSIDGSGGLYAKSKHLNYISSDGLCMREQNPQFPVGNSYSLIRGPWPLLQRGWVFQERYLSRRMLHFGTEEVVWECNTHRRGENWWNPSTSAMANAKDLSSTWRGYVTEYTELQLTFEKDKLMALSGVVERMAMLRPDDRYVAGLWEKTLLHDLDWTADEILARPSSFRGPTWSWASTKGAVQWIGCGELSTLKGVEVVDVTCATTYTGHVPCEEPERT
jgi:hypothetical protein